MNFGQVMQIVYFVNKNIVYYAFIVFRCILLYEFSLSFTLKKIIDYFLINYQTYGILICFNKYDFFFLNFAFGQVGEKKLRQRLNNMYNLIQPSI
jgi:hypothetical protein